MPPLPFWFQGKDTALDITVVNPLQGEVLQVKWEGPLNIECRAQESKFYYNIAFIPLWTLECRVGSVWYNICSSAMAGLTHGAVALPVIMGQRSEATPYPTIHKGSHTIHNVYTSTMDCNAGGRVAKVWDWSSSLEWARAGACGAISGHGSSFWPPTTTQLLAIRCSGAALLPRACIFKFAPIFCRMLQERACKCIWVKDRLDFFNPPLEIQMFNYFPFPKLKVPMILFLLLLMPTLKPSARNLDPCLADGRNPWNLVDPEPKSPSSRFLCQILACPHPSLQCGHSIVYMSPIHLGRSHPVITGPGRRHLLQTHVISPMWSLSICSRPFTRFYLPHVVCVNFFFPTQPTTGVDWGYTRLWRDRL